MPFFAIVSFFITIFAHGSKKIDYSEKRQETIH